MEKLLSPLENEIKAENPLKLSKEFCYKLQKLEEALSKKGFEPVTEDEIKKYADNHKYGYGISRLW